MISRFSNTFSLSSLDPSGFLDLYIQNFSKTTCCSPGIFCSGPGLFQDLQTALNMNTFQAFQESGVCVVFYDQSVDTFFKHKAAAVSYCF